VYLLISITKSQNPKMADQIVAQQLQNSKVIAKDFAAKYQDK
jgi:hypothetical protein